MPSEINLPQLEDSATEATIERYYVQVGDHVEVEQPLVVVLTDRFEWELPATAAGTITELAAESGATISIGAPLARIGESAVERAPQATTNGHVALATPVARKIAAVHGLDLAAVSGSGRGGRITRADVLSLLDPSAKAVVTRDVQQAFALDQLHKRQTTDDRQQETGGQWSAVSGQRSVVSTQQVMISAQPHSASLAPHALTAVEVDLSAALAYVEAERERLAPRGIVINLDACIAHAVAGALINHRMLNSVWSADGVIVRGRVHLGLMQQMQGDASLAVIHNAADLSVRGMARALGSINQQKEAEVDHPTFTIVLGSTTRWSESILTPGQAVCLSVGAVERRPTVIERGGAETITIRPLAIFTLAYDARIVAAPEADACLLAIKRRLEQFHPL